MNRHHYSCLVLCPLVCTKRIDHSVHRRIDWQHDKSAKLTCLVTARTSIPLRTWVSGRYLRCPLMGPLLLCPQTALLVCTPCHCSLPSPCLTIWRAYLPHAKFHMHTADREHGDGPVGFPRQRHLAFMLTYIRMVTVARVTQTTSYKYIAWVCGAPTSLLRTCCERALGVFTLGTMILTPHVVRD